MYSNRDKLQRRLKYMLLHCLCLPLTLSGDADSRCRFAALSSISSNRSKHGGLHALLYVIPSSVSERTLDYPHDLSLLGEDIHLNSPAEVSWTMQRPTSTSPFNLMAYIPREPKLSNFQLSLYLSNSVGTGSLTSRKVLTQKLGKIR